MTWWIWIVGGMGLAGLEALLGGELYLLFFGASAVLVGALSALGLLPELWMQLALFSVAAIGVALPLRKRVAARMHASIPTHEVDATVGRTVIAITTIPAGGTGKAELRGSPWTAVNVGVEQLLEGQAAVVERVDGLTLYVSASVFNSSHQGG